MSIPFINNRGPAPTSMDSHKVSVEKRSVALDRPFLVSLMLSALAAVGATYLAYHYNVILNYFDAQSHLNVARRVLDSRTPGLAQLGTVWLPFPHLLMLPLTANDFLWRSGLAGSIVGLLSFVGTAGTLFLTVRRITGYQSAAWIALAVLILNPNMLYIQTTALTEPILMFTMTASAYFLLKWSQNHSSVDLMVAGFLAALAVGSRYDGWFFAVASSVTVAIIAYWWARRYVVAESLTLAYTAIPLYAMLGWFGYNWIIFGNPLEFQGGRYSAQFQQNQISLMEGLATKHDIILSILTYGWAIVDNAGWLISGLGFVGLLGYFATNRLRIGMATPYLFLAAVPFNVLALWLGQTIIRVPQIPQGNSLPSFNIRYGVLLIPALALFVGWLYAQTATRLGGKIALAIFISLVMVQSGLWITSGVRTSAVMADGLDFQQVFPGREPVAAFLRQQYDGGGVLLDDSQNHVILRSNLAMREYITTSNGALWREALNNPQRVVRWVVLDTENANDQVRTALLGQPNLRENYVAVFTAGTLMVFRLSQANQTDGSPMVPTSREAGPVSLPTATHQAPNIAVTPSSPPIVVSPSPTATNTPTPTVDVSRIALVGRIANAEKTLRSGVFELQINYGNGNHSTIIANFDLVSSEYGQYLHLMNTYYGVTGERVSERIAFADQVGTRENGDPWRIAVLEESIAAQVYALLPDPQLLPTASFITVGDTATLTWYDPTISADATLIVDINSGIPRQLRRVSRDTGVVTTIDYNAWNAPVNIDIPSLLHP